MTPQPAQEKPAQDIRGEVLELIGFVLGRPIGKAEHPSRATEPAWDSLKHVELAFLIEDHFGVRFSEKEVAGIEDLAGIVTILEEKLAAQSRH